MNSTADKATASTQVTQTILPKKIELFSRVLLYRIQTKHQGVKIDINIGTGNEYLPELAGYVFPEDEEAFGMDAQIVNTNPYQTALKDPSFKTDDNYPSEVAATLECSRKMRSYLNRLKDEIEDDICAMLAELDEIDRTLKPATPETEDESEQTAQQNAFWEGTI